MDLKGLGDLASILDMPSTTTGEPMMIDIDLIDEDCNVRSEDNPGFSKESIGELRASLRTDGMESPISLYPNPDRPGRFIINFGHRRFRAAKAEGWRQVPGFLTLKKISRRAQAAENIQRENLTAHEIALYIRDELADGQSQTAIAESLGKSKAWVTQHAKLLDLPDPVAGARVNQSRVDVFRGASSVSSHLRVQRNAGSIAETAAKLFLSQFSWDIPFSPHPVTGASTLTAGLEQEPGATLRLVDPVLDQTGRSDVAVGIADPMRFSQAGGQGLIVFA